MSERKIKKLRKDVVLETVCGISMLIALRPAWGTCPFAVTIAPVNALIWTRLQEGREEESILSEIVETRGFTREKAKKMMANFLTSAEKNHYFLSEEAETTL